MFGFLKKKIQVLLKKTTKEIEEQKPEIIESKEQIIKEPEISFEPAEEKKEKIKERLEELKQEEIKEAQEEKKLSFFQRLTKGFTKFRINEETLDKFFSELEEILIENNVAIEAIDKLKQKLEEKLLNQEIKKSEIEEKIKEALKDSIETILLQPFDVLEKIRSKKEKPYVIVFFGINGSGKTTTIAKFAWLLKKNNLSCVFAASDTFRAASIEQLEQHANKLDIRLIKHKYGSDPAAVAFDAIAHAKAHALDVVLIDTAGRMHTKTDLLKEMEKIVRVSKPDLKIFVAESITGNDAVEQAKKFNEAIGIDAIILTKADVDERGGTAISVSQVTGKPILFLGMGQEYKDLEVFDKKKVVEKIFG